MISENCECILFTSKRDWGAKNREKRLRVGVEQWGWRCVPPCAPQRCSSVWRLHPNRCRTSTHAGRPLSSPSASTACEDLWNVINEFGQVLFLKEYLNIQYHTVTRKSPCYFPLPTRFLLFCFEFFFPPPSVWRVLLRHWPIFIAALAGQKWPWFAVSVQHHPVRLDSHPTPPQGRQQRA